MTDTTLLSNFAHAQRPDLPKLAFPELIVPSIVLAELAEGVRLDKLEPYDWTSIPIVDPTEEDLGMTSHLEDTLHRGEIACIALALRLEAMVITDDRGARRAAESLGLQVSGTLGALVNLVETNHLSLEMADELLSRMRARGYRAPLQSVEPLLDS